jgi:hypothetical protein
VCALFFFSVPLAYAQSNVSDDGEVTKAVGQLKGEISLISDMEPFVQSPDRARLYILKQASQRVLDLIGSKGLANMATIREYQVLIVTYRYSKSYFDRVETDYTTDDIQKIQGITEKIVADRGFDDSPYTQITLSTFNQLQKLTQDMLALPIKDDLKKGLQEIIPDFGTVVAIAKQGDRPKTFAAAIGVYKKVEALYPLFHEVASNNQAFDTVLEIEGLAEFYAEFAQVGE